MPSTGARSSTGVKLSKSVSPGSGVGPSTVAESGAGLRLNGLVRLGNGCDASLVERKSDAPG